MHSDHIQILMATLKISFLFSIILLLPFHSSGSRNPLCDNHKRYCGSPESEPIPFEFPFLYREGNDIDINNNQSSRCGYPGFDVFCNKNNHALLTLSKGSEFVVKDISLEEQRIWINDPNECLPRRFLQQNIDLNDSPFQWDYYYHYSNLENLTFLNCTKFSGEPNPMHDDLPLIPCLSNDKYSIKYTLSSQQNSLDPSCREIGFAMVPVRDGSRHPHALMEGLNSDIVLRWYRPQCNCEADQYCGFVRDTGLDVTCYSNDNNYNFDRPGGNSPTPHRSTYFFPIVWGISGILFFFWVILSVCKDRQRHSQQRQTNIEPTNREPPWYVLGLDRSRIEQYPKIQLAENGQLPKSIDNVCSICLSEYKPMETLRSMPQCNHYFHVDCIDVWLKMNATCPFCRNLPEGSALVVSSLPPPTISYQP